MIVTKIWFKIQVGNAVSLGTLLTSVTGIGELSIFLIYLNILQKWACEKFSV